MSPNLRFGIVGAGVIGRTHAEAIASLPEAELVAVADVIPDQASRLAMEYGARPYTDLAAMLEHEDLDVVNVCTPSGLHGEHACRIMRSGRHVIVEKPMEITRPALDEMSRVQREAAVQLEVISQHRFDEASRVVHDLIAQEALGRLVLGNAQIPWWRSQAYYDSGQWRGTWSLDGGGILMNQSIHSIDILLWLMGPVKSVYAHIDTLAHRIETEDVAAVVVRFQSGALGTIAASTAAYPGAMTRIEVFGDRGSAIIENDRLVTVDLARDHEQEVGPYGASSNEGKRIYSATGTAGSAAALPVSTHAMQIADMIRAIHTGDKPLVDAEEGRRPVEVILAIYESARTSKEVILS